MTFIGGQRNAEQTARLLLSTAFRYDTWECATAKKDVEKLGYGASTVRMAFAVADHALPAEVDAISLSLFDKGKKVFVGATYRLERSQMSEPFVFQAAPKHVLTVELVTKDMRSVAAQEGYRVHGWASCAVDELQKSSLMPFRSGNAQLLLLDTSVWPTVSRPSCPPVYSLGYECRVNENSALQQLMSELVPAGVFVPESFTKATPLPGTKPFRLVVRDIQLSATTPASQASVASSDTDWSVAAVAHNGYQQLGKGAEVPLVLKKLNDQSQDSVTDSPPSTEDGATHGVHVPYGRKRGEEAKEQSSESVALRSEIPLEMDGLPVHSSTSLVLAIRRREVNSDVFKVIGFCVFPLCIMPMKDRDVRVEHLPALRGPFSCEDARMLMVDSSAAYGTIPISMTLTVEYHETSTPADVDAGLAAVGVEGEATMMPGIAGPVGLPPLHAEESEGLAAENERRQDEQMSVATSYSYYTEVGTGEEKERGRLHVPPSAGVSLEEGSFAGGVPAARVTSVSHVTQQPGDDGGIFKLLCTVMEELRRVREAQDELLRRGAGLHRGMSPGLQERLGKKLADGPVDLVDLVPEPVAVPWEVRAKMHEGVQSILHPLHGTMLVDGTVSAGMLPINLFGIRFEGLTMDTTIRVPEDVCFLFSFGPLPFQQVGPVRTSSVGTNHATESFQLYDGDRGGFVWCEPLESLQSIYMKKFKEGSSGAWLYLHIYDALSMFYVGSAKAPLSQFHRPFNSECSLIPMDLMVERDLSLTEQVLPATIFPIVRNAGQLHVTLFCVGIDREYSSVGNTMILREPLNGSRVITAKKLPHAEKLSNGADDGGPPAGTEKVQAATPTENGTAGAGLHWQRAEYVKRNILQHTVGTTRAPGVPGEHLRDAQVEAELEYRLRFVERERDVAKSRKIAEALLSRLTVQHHVHVASWRPEIIRTPFQNMYNVPMQFFVEVPGADADVCTVLGAPSFYLTPKEHTQVSLVLRLNQKDTASMRGATSVLQPGHEEERRIVVKIYTVKREVVRIIQMDAFVGPPLVNRRYEIFAAPGVQATKKLFSRHFSSSTFPLAARQADLVQRLRGLCCSVGTSSPHTMAETNAVLDPITQTFVTAWEEVSITTTVPSQSGRQRIEYVTLFYDSDLSRVYETWELCVFACECVTSRDIYFGQTTVLGVPSEGTEALYCSDSSVRVEAKGSSFLLRLRPKEVGTQAFLLHSLQQGVLRKTLLTVPTTYPTPTYTQVIELTLADISGPIFRRLTFVHRGDREEFFETHHNYRYQLSISPKRFALAPGDTQFLSLQFDALTLPPGQVEGRWPMWIFINNADDKTVESYYVQLVVRAHRVITAVS